MGPGEALDTRYLFVHARVVLHGARAERIEAKIDGVVLRRETREMTDGFHFADFGEVGDFGARVLGAEDGGRIDRGHIERRQLIASFSRRTALKQ